MTAATAFDSQNSLLSFLYCCHIQMFKTDRLLFINAACSLVAKHPKERTLNVNFKISTGSQS